MSTKHFQELLAALNETVADSATLAKSVQEAPAPEELDDDNDEDEGIATAAAEGGAAPAPAGSAEPADGEVLGKSFEVVGPNGEREQAIDATDFLKSLEARQSSSEETLAKALGSFTAVVKQQNEMIKSLSDKVTALSSQGRGRKTMLSVVEKPDAGATMAKSEEGVTPEQFFAKANAMFDAEKLSGKELNVISVCLRSNQPVPQDLISKVMA